MTTAATQITPRKQVARLAAQMLARLQQGYLADRSPEVAALARLRRGAGREAGQLPDLWSLIDTGPLHVPPEGARPLGERDLVRAEDALHVALTLWALHQQSRPTGMHQPDRQDSRRGLGTAVRRMMKPGEIDEPLRKRLVRAGTAADLATLSQRLRDIVVLLRREDIPLDYALLAGQLYAWQRPGGADIVRREWGRSFHAWHPENTQEQAAHTAAPADDETTRTTDTDKDAS
ncbi:type I-E CRISPR-associated protein Cse2/CasB [Streptomyces sp. NE06-03E]|uniref:type I-E CRISPR-associated protein Cse2/CasB n=1 Tax=unclassified Streptomyces TaxID=2593676 RepID=UPI0029BCB0A0|nr:type I-E CRISPR-associated protein Cse2/CasB [Streptomyces sp. NE06-03E]MDX3055990.1 type I-E CRISPR-associated protein Cse2/CasB [Streptomyces sp. NE06-03E]